MDGAQGGTVSVLHTWSSTTTGLVSLSITIVKILKWGQEMWGGGGLGETNCDIKDYTPTLPI